MSAEQPHGSVSFQRDAVRASSSMHIRSTFLLYIPRQDHGSALSAGLTHPRHAGYSPGCAPSPVSGAILQTNKAPHRRENAS